MSFQTIIDQHFPNALSEITFVARSFDWLAGLGFSAENSIACVGRCRDEITRPLLRTIQTAWGSAFDLASLGGLFFAGTTGLTAAIHHAPTVYDRHRYIFFAFPHIGISEGGESGQIQRQGQTHPTTACGALVALHAEIAQEQCDLTFQRADPEQSLLRQRLTPMVNDSSATLIELTHLARQAALEDLEETIAQLSIQHKVIMPC